MVIAAFDIGHYCEKKRLEISELELAKFESDTSKTSKDIALQFVPPQYKGL